MAPRFGFGRTVEPTCPRWTKLVATRVDKPDNNHAVFGFGFELPKLWLSIGTTELPPNLLTCLRIRACWRMDSERETPCVAFPHFPAAPALYDTCIYNAPRASLSPADRNTPVLESIPFNHDVFDQSADGSQPWALRSQPGLSNFPDFDARDGSTQAPGFRQNTG